MPTLSPIEIVVVALLALVVFGPEKLPGIARTIGRTMSQIRRMAEEAKTEFQSGLEVSDDEPVADEPEEDPHADADAPASERPL